MSLAKGDLVEVVDEGLAMLRRMCPGMHPNHHGRVDAIEGNVVFVEFPLSGSYANSQIAPYPASRVIKRASVVDTDSANESEVRDA